MGPFAFDRAALLCNREKRYVGIGCDAWVELCPKNLFSIKQADKVREDISWYRLSDAVAAEAGFHGMRDQGFDLDNFAFFGFAWN